MEFQDVVRKRKMVRSFEERPIPREIVERIVADVDPNDPSATPIEWQGRWRTLNQAWTFAPELENFTTAWSQLNFPRLLFNTIALATIGTIGTVLVAGSSIFGAADPGAALASLRSASEVAKSA